MKELFNWQNIVIPQQDPEYGCIPCGFEWMIRYKGIGELKATFQKDVSLEQNNSFKSVAIEVKKQYPEVIIQRNDFHDGNFTVEFIREHIEKNIPCMVVYPKMRADGKIVGHAAPIVGINSETIKVISSACEGKNQTQEFPIADFLCWYAKCGCSDVAWLDDC